MRREGRLQVPMLGITVYINTIRNYFLLFFRIPFQVRSLSVSLSIFSPNFVDASNASWNVSHIQIEAEGWLVNFWRENYARSRPAVTTQDPRWRITTENDISTLNGVSCPEMLKTENFGDGNMFSISYKDYNCPICLQILIEPVVMPCEHELCGPCFKQNVEEANFLCPLCRMRISSWARRNSRNGTLVNEKRWEQIQKLFPEKCQKRLRGEDDEDLFGKADTIYLQIKLMLLSILQSTVSLRKFLYKNEALKVENYNILSKIYDDYDTIAAETSWENWLHRWGVVAGGGGGGGSLNCILNTEATWMVA